MNESLTLSLGQTLFHAERPAYDRLKAYLDAVTKVLAGTDGDEEILLEVEHCMAELFQAILGEAHRALTLQEVVQVCDQMGDPSAFGDESGAEQDHAPIVAFELVASEDSLAKWHCQYSAQGLTRRTAYHRAKRARVRVEHNRSEVVLWDNISFPEEDGFRGQHAHVTLAVPKSVPFTMNEDVAMALGPLWSERFTDSKWWMATDTGFTEISLPVFGR